MVFSGVWYFQAENLCSKLLINVHFELPQGVGYVALPLDKIRTKIVVN